jgi:hypothetical protein
MNGCHYTERIFIDLFVKVNGNDNGSNPTWASLVNCACVHCGRLFGQQLYKEINCAVRQQLAECLGVNDLEEHLFLYDQGIQSPQKVSEHGIYFCTMVSFFSLHISMKVMAVFLR